ncbi:hypothetical protein [Brevibacillus centrosporus]|uniref:hypothetical protein n=1 Tax=Brevibacillus centrosporus TaxID=54910 RepID=UPI0037F23349
MISSVNDRLGEIQAQLSIIGYPNTEEDRYFAEIPIRLNIQCVSIRDIPSDVESFNFHEDFTAGLQETIRMMEKDGYAGEWHTMVYYTNEEDGYRFYRQEDMDYTDE